MLTNLKTLLNTAQKHQFAVPAFNIGSGSFLDGVIEECVNSRAPVILAVHPLELNFQGRHFIQSCIALANEAEIPVAIHLDHGSNLDQILSAIRAGFSSVMIDASKEDFETNIRLTQRVVQLAHPLGISVEGELGTIGTTGNGESGSEHILYTDPSCAKEFVERTGVDALAVAIGTSHGIYPSNKKPKLRQDLLSQLHDAVPVPLVLHGGSSNEDSEIIEAVQRGICKLNIASDIKVAFFEELRHTLTLHPEWREPFEVFPDSIQKMREVVKQKLLLTNAVGAAAYFHF